jgi:hypothetical protein
MQINFIYDSSVDSAPAGFKQGLAIAAGIIDSIILNPITVNIDIGFGEDNGSTLASTTLGEAQPAFGVLMTYAELVAHLDKAATSSEDATFTSNLPAADPSNGGSFFVSAAQSIAWGALPGSATEIDGYAGFSNTAPFTYSQANGIAFGTYDFVGVALHELTHALGRYFLPAFPTPMNLLAYGANGQIDTTFGDPRYLSIDGGKTSLANFDTNSDPADFAVNSPPDPFNASITSGALMSWSSLDTRLMDLLGYQTTAPAPVQPSDFSLMDVTTHTPSTADGDLYTGPVFGIKYQFISTTSDSVNISAGIDSVFIRSGSGSDALSVANVSGRNVLDGSDGSNFLVGSLNMASRDSFFVDDRGATADIWSTMVNVHAGDNATVWGLTPNDFALSWVNGQGAPGLEGLTLHAVAAGMPTASLTLTGFTTADLSNGRLGVSFGSVSGNAYLNIGVLS